MNRKAKIAFVFPHNNKSGTRTNSKVFIVIITRICVAALSLIQMPLNIQMAIPISVSPIKKVSNRACSCPKMFATISWCRGTRFNTLQKSPFAIQTVAMQYVNSLWIFLSVIFFRWLPTCILYKYFGLIDQSALQAILKKGMHRKNGPCHQGIEYQFHCWCPGTIVFDIS